MSSTLRYELLECIFWGALGLTLYTYLGYPAWMYLRSRLRPHPWCQTPILPTVSVIVAVHNGAALLARKIDHLLALDYPQDRIEIIVVSDGSTDGTNQILEAARHPRLKSIVCRDHRGKAAALNSGIENTRGEILVFVDARPRLRTDSLRFLMTNFADSRVGCAAGQLVLGEDGRDDPGMKAVTGLYWRFEQWIRNCEAQVDSTIGVYGGFYAARRELVQPLPEGTILDDLLQCLSIIRQGYRCVSDERACVYDAWPATSRNEFNRKVRTLAGNFQMLQLAPWILSRKNRLRFELLSHKVLRLVVPLLLAAILIASALLASRSPVYGAALAAQIALYILAALGTGRNVPVVKRLAGPANAFCMLNAAVVVGFYKFLFTRGPLWKIWIPTGNPLATIADDHRETTRAAAGV
jgi:cellulose synthase/poly-beta-1,6-N-acetylglucosamine synthase-like glycosyltransferase